MQLSRSTDSVRLRYLQVDPNHPLECVSLWPLGLCPGDQFNNPSTSRQLEKDRGERSQLTPEIEVFPLKTTSCYHVTLMRLTPLVPKFGTKRPEIAAVGSVQPCACEACVESFIQMCHQRRMKLHLAKILLFLSASYT